MVRNSNHEVTVSDAHPNAFHHAYAIGLHDTDAADVLFSGNLITICHIGYEAMMAARGFSLGSILRERDFGLPVVHIEGDFRKRLTVSDEVDIAVLVSKFGTTSFEVSYELRDKSGELCASAKTVHVCVKAKSYNPMPLPPELRAALQAHAAPES
jgi:YbgC/YbaW family acyl-CoA thioester hydrolase